MRGKPRFRGEDTVMATPTGSSGEYRKVVVASVFGTIIEWYDFLIYGTAAALVFNKLFFPTYDPLVGTLAALAAYGVGFLGRPLGAIIFGHFGDRVGRKAMLIATMLTMGLATFAVGCLPTYEQIGILAPILLVILRILQGVGLGGEWGGAVILVMEHGTTEKRGFYGSLVQTGFPIGLVAASLSFAAVARMPEADFLSWGWRLPFLGSIVLVALGYYVRKKVAESPVFEKLKEGKQLSRLPVVEAITKNTRSFLVSAGLKVSENAWVYILTVFIVLYATSYLKLPRQLILDAFLYAAVVEFITIPIFGYLSDKIGRRPLYFFGSLFTIAFVFPLFWLIDSKSAAIITATVIVALSFGHGTMFGPQAAYFPELFGARVRYSGASTGFQFAAAVAGGFSPIIATAILGYTGSTTGISLYMMGLALITLIATFFARETLGKPTLE
jgi:MHS family shikimate/dehydroshikimate transporter-like MFS transporter